MNVQHEMGSRQLWHENLNQTHFQKHKSVRKVINYDHGSDGLMTFLIDGEKHSGASA
jgi:hypothetical protein